MPVTLMGFAPSEPFPPDEAVTSLDARNLHDVGDSLGPTSTAWAVRAFRGDSYLRTRLPSAELTATRLQGLAPRRSPSTHARFLGEQGLAALLEFSLFRAYADQPWSRCFHQLSSHELRRYDLTGSPEGLLGSPHRWLFGVSLGSGTTGGLSPHQKPS